MTAASVARAGCRTTQRFSSVLCRVVLRCVALVMLVCIVGRTYVEFHFAIEEARREQREKFLAERGLQALLEPEGGDHDSRRGPLTEGEVRRRSRLLRHCDKQ
jgi:hypothetical protein